MPAVKTESFMQPHTKVKTKYQNINVRTHTGSQKEGLII